MLWDINRYRYSISNVIDILHGFKGDILNYFPPGDRKAHECYVARCRKQKTCNIGYITFLEKSMRFTKVFISLTSVCFWNMFIFYKLM